MSVFNSWGVSWGNPSKWGVSWGDGTNGPRSPISPFPTSPPPVPNEGTLGPLDIDAGDRRFLPMYWVPRWNSAYYDTGSLLRRVYFLGIYYYSDLMKQVLAGSFKQKFFGEIGPDRNLFIAKYHYPKTYIPHVTLFVSGFASSAVVKPLEDKGSLLYELTLPCYYKGDTNLYFKNLDSITITVSAVSGLINIQATLAEEPIDTDSPLIIENEWGDHTYIDQTYSTYSAASGTIGVPYDGIYNVYYRSSRVLASLLANTSYIKIDGEKVSLSLHTISNVWDLFAESVLLTRNRNETNNRLKTRSQHMTIASRPNQRIAVALGTSVGISWYTSGGVVMTAVSGYNDWEFQDFEKFLYVDEAPTKSGNNFILTYPPTGYVQVFLNKSKVNEDTYTLSGSYLVPSSLLLSQTTEGNLTVNYKHQRMRNRNYPETGNLYADVPDGKLYRGILVKSVLVENVTKRIKEQDWRWNKDQGLLSGLADFDF